MRYLLSSHLFGCAFVLFLLASAAPASAAPTYKMPVAKQGLTDYNYTPNIPLAQRYAALAPLGVGLKTYNLFWAALESTSIASTPMPMRCPGGTTQVPASVSAQKAQGYNRFHCYNTQAIANFDALLALDQKAGIQSIAVLFNTPAIYRTPGCVASADGLDVGCAPDPSHLDDYEDYVNFLASHYDGSGTFGKISHFIVWNEVSNGSWFNLSPAVDVQHAFVDASTSAMWVNRYVALFDRSARAVKRNVSDALVHVSLNLHFLPPAAQAGAAGTPDIGGKTILDGMWAQIGRRYGWSVAVHPYYEPWVDYGPGVLNFRGLPTLANYQRTQLLTRGVQDPNSAQHAKILASEQGWFDVPLSQRAGNVCKAHQIVMSMPTVIGTTHNFFQSRSPADDIETMIPFAAGEALDGNVAQYPTYQAYLSTRPDVWGARNDHYCCKNYYVGCSTNPNTPPPVAPTPKVIGSVDGILQTSGRTLLHGWACNVGDPDAIFIHLYLGGPAGTGQFFGQFTPSVPSEPAVAAACQTQGSLYRFEVDLSGFLASNPGAKVYVHGISSTGGSNELIANSGLYALP